MDEPPSIRSYTFKTTGDAMQITIDGTPRNSPYTIEWEDGTTHNVNVPSEQAIISGQSKYVFTKWSGKSSSTSTSIPIAASSTSAGTYTANYKTQYHLVVKTEPEGLTSISGSGWYDADSTATTGKAPDKVDDYEFFTWKVDGKQVSSNPISVKMDSAHTATAHYHTDTTPPVIISTSPTSGATEVPVTTTISVTFSEAMDKASAEAAFFTTPDVAGTFSWVENTMTFTPTANLAYSTTYTVTIAATATDLAGNGLDGNANGIAEGSPTDDYTWSFTTAGEIIDEYDHDRDGTVRGDVDDLRMQYNAYQGFLSGEEYDHDKDGAIRGDIDDLRMQYYKYQGF